MILVTGSTGFVGRALTRQLIESGYQVRLLLHPSLKTPDLPRGTPTDVAVCDLQDRRGLQAALVGVDTIFHLAGGEWRGARANLMETDIMGTLAISQTAAEAGVDRIFTVSHLGADRASAYPVLKAKGIAEEHLRRSGVDYTIMRSALLFGPGDSFTSGLARLLAGLPFFFILPGDGSTLIQPLWIEDLVTCLVWALEDDTTRNQVFELGGPEYLTIRQVLETIMAKTGLSRSLIQMRPPYLRALTVVLEATFPGWPVSVFWLDYLASNHTCSLDTIPTTFGLLPARFSQRLDYLAGQNWRQTFLRSLWSRK